MFSVDLNLPVDEDVRHGKRMRVHQLLDDLLLGVVLGLVLALVQDGLADRFLQLVERLVIAQVLGEIVVQLRQFLAANRLHGGLEAHGAAGQRLAVVIRRISDFELARLRRATPRADSR